MSATMKAIRRSIRDSRQLQPSRWSMWKQPFTSPDHKSPHAEGRAEECRELSGIEKLPVELLLQIVENLSLLDRFTLKLSGSRRLLVFLNSLPQLPRSRYFLEVAAWAAKIISVNATTLDAAASVGYLGLVAAIVSNYPKKKNRFYYEKNMVSAMGYAALNGQYSTFVYLLKRLKKLPEQGFLKKPLISWAVEGGNLAIVRLLLAKGARLENMAEEPTLHCAARRGQDDMVELLLASGENISKTDVTGMTALHLAAKYGRTSTVKLLLDNGADAAALGVNHIGTLDMAVIGGHYDIVELLMEYNPHITLARKTSLHWAVEYGRYKTTSLLLTKGADKEARDETGLRPLHYAAKNGSVSVVQLLLDHGANIEAPAESDLTPLHYAALGKQTGVISVLAKRGANMEARSGPGTIIKGESDKTEYPEGWTALFHATMWTHAETVLELLEYGANPNALDSRHQTPLHVAAALGRTRTARVLLAAGASKEAKDDTGQTPLHNAAACGHLETLMTLLDGGCNINAVTSLGQTALHLAAKNFYYVARHLLRGSLDVNAQDTLGRTPLHIAACRHDTRIADLLLDCSADPNARDNDGKTPLHYAALNTSPVFDFLVGRGGDLQAVDNVGCTAEYMHHAEKNSPHPHATGVWPRQRNVPIKYN